MAVIFDPLTGQLINVPASSGGGGGQVTPEVRPISFVSGEGTVIPDNADVVWVDTNIPDYSIVLPANPQENQILKIVGVGGSPVGKVTINANAGQLIDGVLPLVEYQKGLVVQYSATAWYTILAGARNPQFSGTGDPDSLAVYDSAGMLVSDSDFNVDSITNSIAYGLRDMGGTIQATAAGALARGLSSGASSVISAGVVGSDAKGIASADGVIIASGIGSIANGDANGLNSEIRSTDPGAIASGVALAAGKITARDRGAKASGLAIGSGVVDVVLIDSSFDGSEAAGRVISELTVNNSSIIARGSGSKALGSVIEGGFIGQEDSDGGGVTDGSIASGKVDNLGQIKGQNHGTYAVGRVLNGGGIYAPSVASFAHGYADGVGSSVGIFFDPGVLDPTGTNFAWGVATGGGKVYAYNTAATAWGSATGIGSEVKALGPGSTAFGSADGVINSSGTASLAAGFAGVGLEIIATGTGTFAFGIAPLSAPNDGSQVFGTGNGSTANYEMVIGSYAEAPVDGLSRFRVGGGTGIGTEFTAFQVDVDGKSFQKGSEVHRIRLVAATTTLSGRTDAAVVLDTNNTFTVTLPDIAELVDGQTLHLGSTGAGANTVTVAPFAGTTLAANVPTSVVAATEGFTLRYLNTVWYLVG